MGHWVWCEQSVIEGGTRIHPAKYSVPFVGLLALLSGYLAFSALRSKLEWAAATRRPHVLRPAAAEKVEVGEPPSFYAYWAPVGGRLRFFVCRFAQQERPLQTSEGDYVVAIPQGLKVALLLDANLSRLDLSQTERTAIRAAADVAP